MDRHKNEEDDDDENNFLIPLSSHLPFDAPLFACVLNSFISPSPSVHEMMVHDFSFASIIIACYWSWEKTIHKTERETGIRICSVSHDVWFGERGTNLVSTFSLTSDPDDVIVLSMINHHSVCFPQDLSQHHFLQDMKSRFLFFFSRDDDPRRWSVLIPFSGR